MPQRIASRSIGAWIVLIAGFALVHASADEAVAQGAKGRKPPPATAQSSSAAPKLPAQVTEMLDGILAAVRSGRIEDLATPFAWNELPPAIAAEKVDDPIAWWKRQSADGEGREFLSILAAIIDSGHAVAPVGRDVENAGLYVWPRFAEMALDTLTPQDEVQLYRLVPPAMLKDMRAKKRWTWYRLVIGADGTWHSFQKEQ